MAHILPGDNSHLRSPYFLTYHAAIHHAASTCTSSGGGLQFAALMLGDFWGRRGPDVFQVFRCSRFTETGCPFTVNIVRETLVFQEEGCGSTFTERVYYYACIERGGHYGNCPNVDARQSLYQRPGQGNATAADHYAWSC